MFVATVADPSKHVPIGPRYREILTIPGLMDGFDVNASHRGLRPVVPGQVEDGSGQL
jgi:hypothetical protein